MLGFMKSGLGTILSEPLTEDKVVASSDWVETTDSDISNESSLLISGRCGLKVNNVSNRLLWRELTVMFLSLIFKL